MIERVFNRRFLTVTVWVIVCLSLYLTVASFSSAGALNVHNYADLITDSSPGGTGNHTFTFDLKSSIAAGGYLDFDFPAGFIVSPSANFKIRNVELLVDGVPRTATATVSATDDQVIINSGDGGSIRYNLNTTTGISADSAIEFRIGNHTSNSLGAYTAYSSTTGTTTYSGDIEPITNPGTVGTKRISMTTSGASDTTYAEFLISIVRPIIIEDVDTTEEIPPYRFNGAPTSTVGGTTLFVEISLETDEFATCRWSSASGTAYASMTNVFENTGLIFHSDTVAVTRAALNTFFVRCIDDEGNFNTDDYLIQFVVNDQPTGSSNAEGDIEGDGTGSGDSGTGSGSGSGGSSGSSDGGANTTGQSSGGGGGGSGGSGGGGGTGSDSGSQAGGGFESTDGQYPSGDAEVIIRGYAFPNSTVYALVDGAAVESKRANSSGEYSITLSEIARGVYTFGAYAIDANGTKSTTFSTSFTVTGGKTSNLSNVNIMPSIKVEPDPVNIGQTLTISGYSIPNATITLQNQKDGANQSLKTFTTTSGSNGAWSLTVDTGGFSAGTYKVHAKADNGAGLTTNYSDYTYYGVGQNANVPLSADLNRDGSINLTDFSILLFWWNSDGGASDPPADINRDGNVSLTDFSIMLFQWTG